MKRYIVFLSCAVVLGGLATTSIFHDHSPGTVTDLKKDLQTQFDGSALELRNRAIVDYTSVEVIRPKTAMLVIDYGNTDLPKFANPVLPVAHGPPA